MKLLKTVRKRNGQIVPFEKEKIIAAISRANEQTKEMSKKDINKAANLVFTLIDNKARQEVEDIQDQVEAALMYLSFNKTAKEYILYRQKRHDRREINKHLNAVYNQIVYGDAADSDLRRDNANINTDAPMGKMLKAGAEGMKHFIDAYVLDDDILKADREGYLHVHDKDFSLFCWNCCYIDLGKLLKNGFSTGHGYLREPNSIRAAASLACIAVNV